MATNANILQELRDYFVSKGGVMGYAEYRDAEDAPIRPVILKRAFGSWTRLLAHVGEITIPVTEESNGTKTKA